MHVSMKWVINPKSHQERTVSAKNIPVAAVAAAVAVVVAVVVAAVVAVVMEMSPAFRLMKAILMTVTICRHMEAASAKMILRSRKMDLVFV